MGRFVNEAKQWELRTTEQEKVVQEYTPEQEAFYYKSQEMRRSVKYAEEAARSLIRQITILQNNDLAKAILFSMDCAWIEGTLKLMGVSPTMVDFGRDLVMDSLKARYTEMMKNGQ